MQQHDHHDEHTTNEKNWVSCQEMARRLGCHEQTVRRMAHAGIIPGLKVGSYFRFDPEAVEAALAVSR